MRRDPGHGKSRDTNKSRGGDTGLSDPPTKAWVVRDPLWLMGKPRDKLPNHHVGGVPEWLMGMTRNHMASASQVRILSPSLFFFFLPKFTWKVLPFKFFLRYKNNRIILPLEPSSTKQLKKNVDGFVTSPAFINSIT